MEIHPLVQKVYDAIKDAAHGNPEIGLKLAEARVAMATGMTYGLVKSWMRVLSDAGNIYVDGRTVRLVKDYGYREKPRLIDVAEQEVKMRKETRKALRALTRGGKKRGKATGRDT